MGTFYKWSTSCFEITVKSYTNWGATLDNYLESLQAIILIKALR